MILSKISSIGPKLTCVLPKRNFSIRVRRERTSRQSKTSNTASLEQNVVKGENAFTTGSNVGKICVGVAAAAGLGALCFYSVPKRGTVSMMDESFMWPAYVKERIRDTYLYFGASAGVAAASSIAAFRNKTIMRFMGRGGALPLIGSMALVFGTGIFMNALPYSSGFGAKQLAWLVHTSSIGLIVAPLAVLGGPILTRAALYTAGVVGGLSALAVTAPSDKFLYTRGPLAIGLGVVVVSSIGSMFMSPFSVMGAGLYSIALYGGLIVSSGLLLYNTQKCVDEAKNYPVNPEMYGLRPYDPIMRGSCLVTDAINIFIRIAIILASGNRRK